MNVRNLDYIRSKDPRLYEALEDIIGAHANTAQQGNFNGAGQPAPPPAVSALTVSANDGHFQVAIHDPNPVYRGVNYFVEHADNPHFTNPHIIDLGASRNHTVFLGNVTRYWRAYSSYGSSPPSFPAYHGGGAAPLPVTGGGAIGGPSFLPSQGSGTGAPGEGISGPGRIPFRTATGAPPIR